MQRTLKLSTQLTLAFGFLVALTAFTSSFGLWKIAQTHRSLATVYEDRVIPLGQLKAVSDAYAVQMVGSATRYSHGVLDAKAAAAAFDQGAGRVAAEWKAYTQTFLVDAERAGVAEVDKASARAAPVLARLHAALVAADRDRVVALSDEVHAVLDPITEQLDKLVAVQLVVAKAEYVQSEAAYQHAIHVYGWLIGLALASASLTGWCIVRSITRQLGCEVGYAGAIATAIAAGDLSQTITLRAGDTTSLLARLATMQASLRQVVFTVRQNSESVASASAQIAHGNQDLSGRTERQASALQETAATMDELGTTVRTTASSAQQANELAQGASSVATRGGEVVGQVVSTMQVISAGSRRIEDITGVIDGIAFQTNILALNAAVEAARAGDQGRGFAVVASEVRALAQRSAEAAREIKVLIGDSVKQVEDGARLVDQAGRTMGDIVGSIHGVGDIVAQISSASQAQSSGIQQIGEAVSQLDQVTQQNAALVEESAAAAESLRNQARQLVEIVAQFSLPDATGSAVMAEV